jgi:hypothetical protein
VIARRSAVPALPGSLTCLAGLVLLISLATAPAAAAEPAGTAVAAAAISPSWRILNLARDISRFVVQDIAPRVDAGAVSAADTTFRFAGRTGFYSVQWYDADDDHRLSRGDGLDLRFEGCAPGNQPDWDGVVRLPEISYGPGSMAAPLFYADLRIPDGPGGETQRLVGSLAITWTGSASGEKLTVYQGGSGFSFGVGPGGVFVPRIDIGFTCSPAGVFEARAQGEIQDPRFGRLSLVTVHPFTGACDAAGARLPAEGEMDVLRAPRGSVAVRIANGAVTVNVDANGDGSVERRLESNWAALTSSPR